MILITVHDVKAGTWSPPVCVPSIGAACRDFERACHDPHSSAMSFAPQDFDLYQCASWQDNLDSDKHPILVPHEEWRKLASGADYVAG